PPRLGHGLSPHRRDTLGVLRFVVGGAVLRYCATRRSRSAVAQSAREIRGELAPARRLADWFALGPPPQASLAFGREVDGRQPGAGASFAARAQQAFAL